MWKKNKNISTTSCNYNGIIIHGVYTDNWLLYIVIVQREGIVCDTLTHRATDEPASPRRQTGNEVAEAAAARIQVPGNNQLDNE